MNKLPDDIVRVITTLMSRQNLKSLSGVSKSMKKTVEETKSRRRQQYQLIKALTTLKRTRARRQLTPRDRLMAQAVRVLARVPKTYRHSNGYVYPVRQRLSEFLFEQGRLRPNVQPGIFGGISKSHGARVFGFINGIGGSFYNHNWVTTIPVHGQVKITKR